MPIESQKYKTICTQDVCLTDVEKTMISAVIGLHIKKLLYFNQMFIYFELENDSLIDIPTKRKLDIRIKEHKSALNRPSIHSNVADHSAKTKHDIDFANPKITYVEKE